MQNIAETKDVAHHERPFYELIKICNELIKVSKQETPVYYRIAQWDPKRQGAKLVEAKKILKPLLRLQMLTVVVQLKL